uniref:Glycine zipper domain-containing protein n=1 Tax=Desulfobacca acetoxidans TaxID=60893 RepID=A0A7V4G9T3_9BACT
MMRKCVVFVVLLIFTVSLAGCATDSGYYDPARSAGAGALGGAAAGAALGSIIGAAAGAPGKGAWIGAASGALAGGIAGAAYAHHKNQQLRSREAAMQQYQYAPGQAAMVDINEAVTQPPTVRPGQTVDMVMTYTILTPDNAPTQVTLYRAVTLGNTQVGQPYQVQAVNQNGTYQDRVGFQVPPDAPAGTYTVSNRVMTGFGSQERISYFTVVQ